MSIKNQNEYNNSLISIQSWVSIFCIQLARNNSLLSNVREKMSPEYYNTYDIPTAYIPKEKERERALPYMSFGIAIAISIVYVRSVSSVSRRESKSLKREANMRNIGCVKRFPSSLWVSLHFFSFSSSYCRYSSDLPCGHTHKSSLSLSLTLSLSSQPREGERGTAAWSSLQL